VGKSISHHCKFKIEGLNLGKSLNEESEVIENGVDVLVSTYKRLTGFIQRRQLFLSNLEWMVIDEADTFA
jgi:superfamily II DNA/RNA helicase